MESWTANAWGEWLLRVLSGEVHTGVHARDLDLHQQIIDVYLGLKTAVARNRFGEGVVKAFEHTPIIPANTEMLYYLLHLLAYTHPFRGQERVHRYLLLDLLRPFVFEQQNLHTLLLMTTGKYEITDEIVDYIQRSARRHAEMEYLTACMRVLASRDRKLSIELLPVALAAIQTPAEAAALARYLKGFTSIYGYRGLYEWWIVNEEMITERDVGQRFYEALTTRYVVENETEKADTEDPYRLIFSAYVHASRRPLRSAEVFALAQMQDTMTAETLEPIFQTVMQKQIRTNPKWFVRIEAPLWGKAAKVQPADFLTTAADSMRVEPEHERHSDFIAAAMTPLLRDVMYIPSAEAYRQRILRLVG